MPQCASLSWALLRSRVKFGHIGLKAALGLDTAGSTTTTTDKGCLQRMTQQPIRLGMNLHMSSWESKVSEIDEIDENGGGGGPQASHEPWVIYLLIYFDALSAFQQ